MGKYSNKLIEEIKKINPDMKVMRFNAYIGRGIVPKYLDHKYCKHIPNIFKLNKNGKLFLVNK